jgi:Tol biopolymer transport system component
MRTPVIAAALLAVLVAAAPAQAKLVYVKRPASAKPAVYLADDNGAHPDWLGIGRAPAISPDGRWVAFIGAPRTPGDAEQLIVQAVAGGSQRIATHARALDALRFSPDSRKLGVVIGGRRLRLYDLARDRVADVVRGNLRGWSFSPDSQQIAVGRATSAGFDATADLFTGPAAGGRFRRLTATRDALNPVWGPSGIVFDRQRRRNGDAPAYDLWRIDPAAGTEIRRITKLAIPRLVSGLVPLEVSRDGSRLLAAFTGQDTEVGFTVIVRTGRTRALSRDFEHGFVGFDLSANGRTILGHSGGPDPASRHDVVSMPFRRGGRERVLVRNAGYPAWSR